VAVRLRQPIERGAPWASASVPGRHRGGLCSGQPIGPRWWDGADCASPRARARALSVCLHHPLGTGL